MITLTNNPSAAGCPVIDGGRPPGYLPIVIADGPRSVPCWLSVASIHARTIAAAPIVVQDADIPALRASGAIGWGHFRTDAERAAETASAVTQVAEEAKRARRKQDVIDIANRIRAIAQGLRTPVDRETLAICRALMGDD